MKFGLTETYGCYKRPRLVPHVFIGPVMWRCTNGRPNHKTEWRLHFHPRENCISGRWYLLPAFEFHTWRKSVLASEGGLGREYYTVSLNMQFLRWEFEISIGRSTNNKVGTGDIAP